MTTFYLDYEGGNDANDGLTFANRWKTITSGATAARIAPGDTIRVMASPDPTSIGTATWTGGSRPASVAISSSTNATPIVITTSTAHGLVAGDYVSIVSHTTNTNANGVWKVGTVGSSTTFQILQMDGSNTTGNGTGGATGNATKVNNCIVKLASPVTQNIALCGGLGQKPAWTASASVTTAQLTTAYKEGYSSASIAIAAAFTTGKAAYYTLPSTLDLSGYQQVSFWVQLNSGTVGAAGSVYVALCTDTTGDTVAHTCNVPALGATSQWVPVTVNLGTNLNAAIRSVAFYVVTDNGAQTFYLDNIIAVKASSSANSLSLTSLTSKSDGTGDEAWYAIQSINYDAVMLANDNAQLSTSTAVRGYSGTSETVTTYKRETIKTIPVGSSGTAVQSVQDSGTSGNPITFSGGWNRTDMSTQTGQTWFDGQNGLGTGLVIGQNYISWDRIHACRYTVGLNFAGSFCTVGSTYATANGGTFVSNIAIAGNNNTFTNVWCNNGGYAGQQYGGLRVSGYGNAITTIKNASNCPGNGVALNGCYNTDIGSILAQNCANEAMYISQATRVSIGTATLNTAHAALGAISVGNCSAVSINGGSSSGSVAGVTVNGAGILNLNNYTINETVEVAAITAVGQGVVYSNRHDNTDGNNWQWQGAGTINQQTSVVDSPATTAWKMNPTTANATAAAPLALKLGTVVCAASSLVTVTARMRRSNTGLTMRLICPGGQIVGVTNDVYSDMTAAADTWETVTITFTPTKPGGVDIYAYAFGGTTYSGYVCNLSASQA